MILFCSQKMSCCKPRIPLQLSLLNTTDSFPRSCALPHTSGHKKPICFWLCVMGCDKPLPHTLGNPIFLLIVLVPLLAPTGSLHSMLPEPFQSTAFVEVEMISRNSRISCDMRLLILSPFRSLLASTKPRPDTYMGWSAVHSIDPLLVAILTI